MRQDAGLLLIILALFSLWLYNTGRASAMLRVIKDPSAPASSLGGVRLGGGSGVGGGGLAGGGGGGGGTTGANIALCYEMNSAGGFNPGCIENIWKGLNSPDDVLKTVGNLFDPSGLFGGLF